MSGRKLTAALLLPAVVSLAACGTRLPHHDIVADAAGAARVTQLGTGAGATGSSAGSNAPGAVAGTGTVLPVAGAQGPSAGTATIVEQAGREGPATGSPVVIGNVGSYSGVLGSIFGPGQTTAQVAAKWLNAHGGLNGHVVQLITADDGGDPAKYQALVKDMVDSRHAIAFMGNLAPFSANGGVAYLEQRGVPVVGGDVINDAWTQSRIMFPQLSALAVVEAGLPKLGTAVVKHNFAIFYCAESTLCTVGYQRETQDVPQAGGRVVYSAQVSLAQPDFTSECLQAQSKGADAIIVGADGNTLSRAANSCAQQNYHPLWLTLHIAMIDSIASNPNLQGARGTMGSFPWAATDIQPARDYRAAMSQYAPGAMLGSPGSAVWTAALLLRVAAANLPASGPSSQDILKGLWQIKNNNLGGAAPPLTFVQGQPAPPANCYFITEIDGNAWRAPSGSRLTC